jgi:hypothetical protein
MPPDVSIEVYDAIDRRLMRIETIVERLETNARSDFRLLFGAIITLALGLGGLMAKGFHWL